MAKSKKLKSGVFNIFVNERYVDKVCASGGEDLAVDKFKQGHPTETGSVTAKWVCVAPVQLDCDEYVKQLRQNEIMLANAVTPTDQNPV